MSNWRRILIGLFISTICLYWTFRSFHFEDLLTALKQANYLWFLPPLFIYVISFLLRALRWQVLLLPIKKIPYPRLFFTLVFGFFINTIMPLRAGEFARAYSLSKSSDLRVSLSLGSIATERLTDLFGLLFLMGLASRLFPAGQLPIWKLALLFVLGLAMAYLVFGLFRKYGESWEKRGTGLPGKLIRFARGLSEGLSALKSPTKLSLVALLSVLIWMVEATVMFFLSRAFALNLSYFQSAALVVGLAAGVIVPAAPGYIGTLEFFGQQTLVMLGYPPSLSLSFILAMHFFQMVNISILGLISLFKLGTSNPIKSLKISPQTS
ncbi:MAG: flippase-like domain-containing protein [Elusimicrobia bacterium]|nr:flippase-like domain-containing protein [Candidatus Obscuribacterium magneticum]